MPGVLQVEALAQVGAVCGLSHPDFAGKLAVFAGIDGVRFKRIVRPGDVLDLTCEINGCAARWAVPMQWRRWPASWPAAAPSRSR